MSLHLQLQSVLADLELATPEPPPPITDAADVLCAVVSLMAAREPVLRRLKLLMEESPGALANDEPSRHKLAVICERDAQWSAAMARARHELAQRLQSCTRLRRMRRSGYQL